MAADTFLFFEPRGDVLLLKLNDPSGFPRLSRSVLREIDTAIRKLTLEREWCGAVICGTEQCFSAGADLEEIATLTGSAAREFAQLGQRVMSAIEKCPKPVIAAIRGYCMGGGLDLALACHARLATNDAILAHRGASLGIITGWGGTQRLARVVGPRGRALALELMTTARSLGANEAFGCGLITAIFDVQELLPSAITLARADTIHRRAVPGQTNGR